MMSSQFQKSVLHQRDSRDLDPFDCELGSWCHPSCEEEGEGEEESLKLIFFQHGFEFPSTFLTCTSMFDLF